MNKTHEYLKQPAISHQGLWRYIEERKLNDLLRSEKIYFSKLASLSDAMEGKFTEKDRRDFVDWHVQRGAPYFAAQKASGQLEDDNRDQFYVNCWHMSDHESYLMWRAYASKGYAIYTTYERLKYALAPAEAGIYTGVVDYVDFERKGVGIDNAFRQAFTKNLPYKDEKEMRLLIWELEQENRFLPFSEKSVCVSVDIYRLIKKIYVSPLNDKVSEETRMLLAEKGFEPSRSNIFERKQA